MDEAQYYPGLVGPSRVAGGTTVLELSGDLDILAVSVLSGRLDDLTGAQGADLVLDLRAVTFIDCAGLSLLSRARYRTRQRGGRLRLAGVIAGGSVARLLRMTGLTGDFEIASDDGTAGAGDAATEAAGAPGAGSAVA
ncbi:STAS domain-containing protein [Streptomyces inhibens]|uniref:STAS domain-containing protein n=1 Tax=Streptomyces inhibens TaxID=2293571 RepID=UPI001EE71665|nr:STAS domain-containing protein [Streptomyces inhibens]UKY48491.1 STAS domain-containing protein [Streptomyces inhibens]